VTEYLLIKCYSIFWIIYRGFYHSPIGQNAILHCSISMPMSIGIWFTMRNRCIIPTAAVCGQKMEIKRDFTGPGKDSKVN
jgi:hypothetical protein